MATCRRQPVICPGRGATRLRTWTCWAVGAALIASLALAACGPSTGGSTVPALPAPGARPGVSISSDANGFSFQNHSAQWVWVSFAILTCHDVDAVYGCNSGTWTETISLGPSAYSRSSQSCALMEDISSGAPSYSYTVQWVAYADPSGGSQYQPDASPQYGPNVGTLTPVTEQAGTDHGADTCVLANGSQP